MYCLPLTPANLKLSKECSFKTIGSKKINLRDFGRENKYILPGLSTTGSSPLSGEVCYNSELFNNSFGFHLNICNLNYVLKSAQVVYSQCIEINKSENSESYLVKRDNQGSLRGRYFEAFFLRSRD